MRLAFITPRYGADIASGPEHACRLLAEQVSVRHDVDVLTTCAHDPKTWKNVYAEGSDRVRGVRVRRFPATHQEDQSALQHLTNRLLSFPHARSEELEWVRRSGPWAPGLQEHLKRQHRAYDALVFFSLTHPTTVHGLQVAPERSLLFPHLQLRPTLRFDLWTDVLSTPRALGLLSVAERRLLRGYVLATVRHEELVGIGIDPPPQQSYPRHQQDPADAVAAEDDAASDTTHPLEDTYLASRGVPFRRRHRLYGRFALYGGRIEPDNGCEEMLEYFDTYSSRSTSSGTTVSNVEPSSNDGDTALVLMGVKMMKVPDARFLRQAGVLPERERMVAYEAADVTIAPASDDLTAQPLLESMAVGTPVLASARNPAAVEHVRRANAGLYYATREEFVAALRLLMNDTRLRERLGENGRTYVRQNLQWDAVLGRFERLITRVKNR